MLRIALAAAWAEYSLSKARLDFSSYSSEISGLNIIRMGDMFYYSMNYEI